MSRCTLILLALILALAVGVYFFTQHAAQHPGVQTVYVPLGQRDWIKAEEIWVYQGEPRKGFRLVKREEGWVIKGAFDKPACPALVKDFLKELAALSGEKRACGRGFFPRFRLTQKEALHIVLARDGQVLAHILVGKRGPRWQSTFVRLKGKDCIYLVPVNLLAKFDVWSKDPAPPKDKEFVRLSVFDEPLVKMKSLRFVGHGVSWSLTRGKDRFFWQEGGTKKVLSPKEAQRFWQHLFPLYAEDLLPPEKFSREEAKLIYESRLGRRVVLSLGPCLQGKDQEKVCVVKREGFVYRVRKDLLKPLWSPEMDF